MDRENPAGSGSSYGHRTGEEGSQPRFVNKDEISGPVGANLSEFKTLEHKMLFSLAIELASFFFFNLSKVYLSSQLSFPTQTTVFNSQLASRCYHKRHYI